MFNKKEWGKIYDREYYKKNQNKILKRKRIWNEVNKEKIRLYRIKYRLTYKDKREKLNNKHNKLYRTFSAMRSRCYNHNHKSYKNYGGRGIKVMWISYEEFKNDVYKSYMYHLKKYGRQNTTIERKDNNGNYCKENCRWATLSEQQHNKRETQCLTGEKERIES